MIEGEKILDFLADAWEWASYNMMEIIMGVVVMGFVILFGTMLVLAIQDDNEKAARLEYCYKQGYVEVIESKHDPRYYCFDARLDPVAFRSIPSKVWEDE